MLQKSKLLIYVGRGNSLKYVTFVVVLVLVTYSVFMESRFFHEILLKRCVQKLPPSPEMPSSFIRNVKAQRLLPQADQKWEHSVVTRSRLYDILHKQNEYSEKVVTAIETDVLRGTYIPNLKSVRRSALKTKPNEELVPILAHPPKKASDLSVDLFFDMIFSCRGKCDHKHIIKLDFKENDVVLPTLESLNIHYRRANEKKALASKNNVHVFLNADVLPGPGKTAKDVNIDGDKFFNEIAGLMVRNKEDLLGLQLSFSLGWAIDHRAWGNGYNSTLVDDMIQLVRRHQNLTNHSGTRYKGLYIGLKFS